MNARAPAFSSSQHFHSLTYTPNLKPKSTEIVVIVVAATTITTTISSSSSQCSMPPFRNEVSYVKWVNSSKTKFSFRLLQFHFWFVRSHGSQWMSNTNNIWKSEHNFRYVFTSLQYRWWNNKWTFISFPPIEIWSFLFVAFVFFHSSVDLCRCR